MAADKAQLPHRSRAQVLCGIFHMLNVSQWVEWGGFWMGVGGHLKEDPPGRCDLDPKNGRFACFFDRFG
jgi:hypothetical protein